MTTLWFNSYVYVGGGVQFARIIDANGSSSLGSVACDSSGNVYLAGWYTKYATIETQDGEYIDTLPAVYSTCAFFSKFDKSGVYQYSRIVDGINNEYGISVARDSSGNVYLAGWYDTSTEPPPVIKTQNATVIGILPVSLASIAGFVSKFDSSGTYQYSRIVDGTGSTEVGYGVACDSSGNMYLAGYYTGSAFIRTVNSSNVVSNVATLPTPLGGAAAFVSKFDSSGTYQYSRVIDGTGGNDFGYSVACDSSGNMYFAGYSTGGSPIIRNVTSSNVTSNVATLPASLGGDAAFVSKFDSSGTYQYSRLIDGTGTDYGISVACDSSGNMYLAGYYSTASPFIRAVTSSNVTSNVATLPTPLGGFVAFLSKFDSSGAYQYSRIVDGTGADAGNGVTCDSSGNVYFSGLYSTSPVIRNVTSSNVTSNVATLPASLGGDAAFLSKFDSSGVYQYTEIIDGTGGDNGNGVGCDSSGNVYLTGQIGANSQTFIRSVSSSNVVSNVATLPVVTNASAFVIKFSSTGGYSPAAPAISSNTFARIIDGTGTENGNGVACDSSGNVYLVGNYSLTSATIKDQNGNSIGTLVAPSTANSSVFVSKFTSSGVYQYSRVIDGTGAEQGLGVACDSSGNMYITGLYNLGAPTIEDQAGNGIATLPAPISGSNAAFVSKFDSSGTYQYSRVIDGTGNDQGTSVTCDSSGNLYFAGYYTTTSPTIRAVTSSNVVSNVATLPASLGSTAAFVSKFDSSGVYQYTRIVDATGGERGQGVVCDSSGNMYLAGFYGATAATIRAVDSSNAVSNVATLPASLGITGGFVSKFDSSGTYQYSRIVDGTSGEEGYGVACDSSGNMYLAGLYGTASPVIRTVDSSNVTSNVATLPASLGSSAAFVSKFNSSGTYQYTEIVDGTQADEGLGVTCDSTGNVYFIGSYGTASPVIRSVNSSNVVSNVATLPASLGSTAAFVSKFNSSGTYQYTRIIDGSGADVGQGVACDTLGNLYFAGRYATSVAPTILAVTSSNVTSTMGYLPPPATSNAAAFLVKFDSSGNYNPVQRVSPATFARLVDSGDSSGTDQGNGVACDSSGNVYLAGFYAGGGTPTIKNQAGTSLGTLPAPVGVQVAFVSKFDSSGTYQYSRLVDGSGNDAWYNVACDSSGNVYISGFYQGTPTIKDQTGTSLGTLPSSTGVIAAFACKFDSSGTYKYARIIDGSGNNQVRGVACDSSENMYLGGFYEGTPTIKDQAGTSLGTLPSVTLSAAFACKFNSSGTYQYARLIDGSGYDQSLGGIACDSSGNMYLPGFYPTGTTPTIKDQAGNSLGTLPLSSGEAAFVCKFDSSGTYQYSRIVDGANNDRGLDVACDSSGNMYFGGYYTGTPTIKDQAGTSLGTLPTSGSNVVFVCKFDSSGTYQYSRIVDPAGGIAGLGVACDSSGNMYLASFYSGSPTIKDQAGNSLGTLPASVGSDTAFVCKFNSSGTYQYARIVDGVGSDQAWNVTCDSSGNVCLSGYYSGTPTIKDQAGNSLGTLPAASGQAAFVVKFSPDGVYSP